MVSNFFGMVTGEHAVPAADPDGSSLTATPTIDVETDAAHRPPDVFFWIPFSVPDKGTHAGSDLPGDRYALPAYMNAENASGAYPRQSSQGRNCESRSMDWFFNQPFASHTEHRGVPTITLVTCFPFYF